jgi:hypothetical protein
MVAKMPPRLENAEAYWRWTVDAHNAVNVRLGKPMWQEGSPLLARAVTGAA